MSLIVPAVYTPPPLILFPNNSVPVIKVVSLSDPNVLAFVVTLPLNTNPKDVCVNVFVWILPIATKNCKAPENDDPAG